MILVLILLGLTMNNVLAQNYSNVQYIGVADYQQSTRVGYDVMVSTYGFTTVSDPGLNDWALQSNSHTDDNTYSSSNTILDTNGDSTTSTYNNVTYRWIIIKDNTADVAAATQSGYNIGYQVATAECTPDDGITQTDVDAATAACSTCRLDGCTLDNCTAIKEKWNEGGGCASQPENCP